jgi:hypothetical protein
MTALSIQPTFPIFTDIDGQPLENGYIWLGTANLDPQTNPINVYWDAALTIPASQPIRTLAGYPSRNGTPARLYVNSDYSIRVQNRNGSLVYSAPAATERYGNVITLSDLTFLQAGAGADPRTALNKMREMVSVLDFIPEAEHAAIQNKTSTYDCTADVAAAIAYVDSIADAEKFLHWPAGWYRVGKIDLTNTREIMFHSDGYVLWIGNNAANGFVFGTTNYNPSNPSASTITAGFRMIAGNFEITALAGQNYTYGARLEHFYRSVFQNMSVSGNFGSSVGANRIATYMQYSYTNTFFKCSFGSPGVPDSGYLSTNFFMDNNNCNLNTFDNCNWVGVLGQPTLAGTVGVTVTGNSNQFRECDISAIYIAIDITRSSGGTFIGNYHESVSFIVRSGIGAGIAQANTFIGGYYEVLQNQTAFTLENTQNTTIIGPRIRGYSTEVNQTFIDQGTACYGLNVISPNLEYIAIPLTGTYRGNAGTSSLGITQSQWVTFPSTQVSSTEPNTLDDYEEGTWTPTCTGVTFTTAVGQYRKIGSQVTLNFKVTFPVTADTGFVRFINLPFSGIAGSASEANGLAVGYNATSFQVGGTISTTTLLIHKVGASGAADPTNADFSNTTFAGSITFNV